MSKTQTYVKNPHYIGLSLVQNSHKFHEIYEFSHWTEKKKIVVGWGLIQSFTTSDVVKSNPAMTL